VECNKWKTECNHCPQRKEYPVSIFIDRSRKNYILKKKLFTSVPNMTVVSVSNWLNNVVRDSFLGNSNLQVMYNGIDIDVFTPTADRLKVREKLNKADGFMLLGVATPWSKRKGLNDFIELSKSIDNTDFIVLVGLNESQIKELPPNIIGITHTENQHELKDLYATADVFLNLSVEETFGLTTAEALSCGTPAVVYNATACPEIIDIDTGIVVPKNDITSLLNAIETIKKKGKEFYSEACRKRAVNYFNKKERFQEYIDLYEKSIIHKCNGNK
jgi:glycosyltransferase involved in cell wall biosynthesis